MEDGPVEKLGGQESIISFRELGLPEHIWLVAETAPDGSTLGTSSALVEHPRLDVKESDAGAARAAVPRNMQARSAITTIGVLLVCAESCA